MPKNITTPKLWSKNFLLVFISSLLLFFSFYMLVPILPFYLIEELNTNEAVAGIVLSLYTIAALIIRPFSGFMVDKFDRKKFYLLCYALFCIVFAGYVFALTLAVFIVLRLLHGGAFGLSTVSGSTLAVDIIPSERRGEGIGYYGMSASMAMATGPMIGLWLYKHYSFDTIFIISFVVSLIGFVAITLIKPPQRIVQPQKDTKPQKVSLDRFVLLRALPCVGLLAILGFGYGAISNYVGMYCADITFGADAGLFFLVLAIGIVLARVISAKTINAGLVLKAIYIGSFLILTAFILFVFSTDKVSFYIAALTAGAGFGYINPAFQSMYINLAPHNRRGTANATYFTFWDMGIGIGIALGGLLIEQIGYSGMFAVCAAGIVLGILYFRVVSASYYRKSII